MEQEQQGQEEQDLHLDKDIPDSFGLLSEQDQADAEEKDPEDVAVAAGEEVKQGEVYWAMERRGCFLPCQVVPYAMVPQEVVREGITWVKLFGEEQFKPLATWQLAPFLGNTIILSTFNQ